MDKETEERFIALEKIIGSFANSTSTCGDRLTWLEDTNSDVMKLIAMYEKRFEILERHDRAKAGMLRNLKKMIDVQTGMIETLQSDIEKLSEAYYRVFPERLVQDVRMMRQMEKITSRPSPDADPNKP